MSDDLTSGNCILFDLQNRPFAVSAASVREMINLSEVRKLPDSPKYFRGIVKLREDVIPVVDLRVLLGMPSFLEETGKLLNLLQEREQDHRNWLAALEKSIQEEKEFTLARDPHKCAFGRWYDSFETKDHRLARLLEKFDAPHRRIHALADEAITLVEAKGKKDAIDLINKTREGDLHVLIELFENAYTLLRDGRRELGIILEKNGKSVVAAVDNIDCAVRFTEESIKESELTNMENDFISHVCQKQDLDKMVLIIRAEAIIDKCADLKLSDSV